MNGVIELVRRELQQLEESHTYKYEVPLQGPQDGVVRVKGKKAVMLASNNYLGLSNHRDVCKAAIRGIKDYGYGVASVRFICGTQDIHLDLERRISKFLGTEDTILFSSCWAANEAFFASLTNEKMGYETYRDVIYSDRLNHASIIDGQRLCKAETTDRKIYRHADTDDLVRQLEEDRGKDYRLRIIATDGVFSMEGDLAPLDRLVDDCRPVRCAAVRRRFPWRRGLREHRAAGRRKRRACTERSTSSPEPWGRPSAERRADISAARRS